MWFIGDFNLRQNGSGSQGTRGRENTTILHEVINNMSNSKSAVLDLYGVLYVCE